MGLLPAVIAFGAYSVGCLLLVLYKMAREEDMATAFLGLSVVYAFVWGWRNADTEDFGRVSMRAVMSTWSICMGGMVFYWLIMAPKG